VRQDVEFSFQHVPIFMSSQDKWFCYQPHLKFKIV